MTTKKKASVASTTIAPFTCQTIGAFADALSRSFAERDQHIQALLGAFIAEQHALLIGPPGGAKSALVRAITSGLGLPNRFELLFSRFTQPDEVFGPISLKGLEQDRYRRMTTGYLPDAQVAFLDEVFKASSAILNTLLVALNERQFHDDGGVRPIPLQWCVGASNELPSDGDSLEAFGDRFLVRLHVDRLGDKGARAALMTSGLPTFNGVLADGVIDDVRARARALTVQPSVIDALITIRNAIHDAGVFVSDRRWRQSVGYLRARVAMRDEDKVRPAHLMWLGDVLWSRIDDVPRIMQILEQHAAPWMGRVASVSKMLDEQVRELDSLTSVDASSLAKLGTILETVDAGAASLDAIAREHPDARQATDDVAQRIGSLRTRVVQTLTSRVQKGGGQ